MSGRTLEPDGFGTWDIRGETCQRAVETALEAGYRHIDTARMYGNEEAVGAAIERSDVDRSDLYLATKVWDDSLGHEAVLHSAEASRRDLGVSTIDLLYVHWPRDTYAAAETLPAFDELIDRGVIREVGLSNFTPALLDQAREVLEAPIRAHQVEMHPFLPQEELLDYADAHDHTLVAYCPLARGAVLDEPAIRSVADRHGVSPAQVSIAWVAAKGAVPIPRSSDPAHIRENHEALSLSLSAEDIATIDEIERRERVVNPANAAWNR